MTKSSNISPVASKFLDIQAVKETRFTSKTRDMIKTHNLKSLLNKVLTKSLIIIFTREYSTIFFSKEKYKFETFNLTISLQFFVIQYYFLGFGLQMTKAVQVLQYNGLLKHKNSIYSFLLTTKVRQLNTKKVVIYPEKTAPRSNYFHGSYN